MPLSTPSITPMQVVAVVQAIIAVVIAFGLPLTTGQSDAIIQLATVLAAVLPLSDAGIRVGRARAASRRSGGDA